MNEFKNYHPIVNFIYFMLMIILSCIFMNPVCILISFVGSFAYAVVLGGKKTIKKSLLYSVPLVALTAMVNTLFNHEGATIISYLPNGNPFTLESLVYGASAAVMIVTVIHWFSCYNNVMTSDKFIYLFGKIIPTLSLIFSMTLRFVPKFTTQFKKVSEAQKCLGKSLSSKGIIKRAKYAVEIMSIMVTWAFENSVDTADSMKSRGYGLPGRTSFSIFKFTHRDILAIISTLILGSYVITGRIIGNIQFDYFPLIQSVKFSVFDISIYLAYFLLATMPVIIEIREAIKWKYIKLKI